MLHEYKCGDCEHYDLLRGCCTLKGREVEEDAPMCDEGRPRPECIPDTLDDLDEWDEIEEEWMEDELEE